MRAVVSGRVWVVALLAAACGGSAGGSGTSAGESTTSVSGSTGSTSTSTSEASSGSTQAGPSTTCDWADCGSSSGVGEASSTGSTGSTTGGTVCAKNVVLTGYWPPTNEMLRAFSTNPTQNPDGWQGQNWRGHGYDVYAFFPEFPPDGDPTNDAIGDVGAVGSPESDMRVDYQDTSEDFWRIMDDYGPLIVITTSRGGGIDWELEALEGGHGDSNPGDPSADWTSDGFGAETFPVESSVDPRSWMAMTQYRQGVTIDSALPLAEILAATDGLTPATVEIDLGTSGDFLSGFAGLHGLYYESTTAHSVAAGHIHVGFGLDVGIATTLLEQTLETVLLEHPADETGCSPELARHTGRGAGAATPPHSGVGYSLPP